MARRRSLNRRWSRRSGFNITELDQNSEILENNDPMWWKHLEGDVTARPSQGFSNIETTGEILDNDSRVSRSELTGDWWKSLDKTNPVESPRRTSARKSSIRPETPNESLNSEKSENVSIKKKKVLLQTRRPRSDITDNFSKALVELEASKKRKSTNDRTSRVGASDNEAQRKRHRSSDERDGASGRNDDYDSANTSNDTDVIVKARPRAFQKRTRNVDDRTHDDILGGKTIDDELSSKTASHRRALSSISRKLNLQSDESESDGGRNKKVKPNFRAKKQEKMSINPFDEILSGHLDDSNVEGATIDDHIDKNSSARRTGNASPGSRVSSRESAILERRNDSSTVEGLRRSPRKRKSTMNEEPSGKTDRRSILKANSKETLRTSSGTSMTKNLTEILRLQQIEKIPENDENTDKSSMIALANKQLKVSITRIEDSSDSEQNVEPRPISRILRSSSQSRAIVDSAYELPDKERSGSISSSEMDIEVPIQNNLMAHLPIARETRSTGRTSRASMSRKIMDDSRTKIFSDEDISIEDFEERRMILERTRKSFTDGEKSTRKSLTAGIISHESTQPDENINEVEEEIQGNRSLSNIQEVNTRISGNNVAATNKSRRSNKADENNENATKAVENKGFPASSLKGKSSGSKKSITFKFPPDFRSVDSIHEEELDDREESRTLENLVSQEKSRESEKSFAITNKSRQSRSDEIPEREIENHEESAIFENTESQENSRVSRKSFAITNKSRQSRSDKIPEDEIENEEENPIFENPVLPEEPRSSRKSFVTANKSRQSRSDETTEGEIENEEQSPILDNPVLQEKSRISKKSFVTANKSHQSRSDEIPEGEIENREDSPIFENTESQENSRASRKSFAITNKSRQSRSDKIPEDEIENEEENPIFENPVLQEEPRSSRKSFVIANKSRQSRSDETTEREIENEELSPILDNPVLQEKSRISKKSLATANKSHQSRSDEILGGEIENREDSPILENKLRQSQSGESISEDEIESDDESSIFDNIHSQAKSHSAGKSLVPTRNSQQSQSVHSITEDEIEDAETNAVSKEESRTFRKSVAIGKKSQSQSSGSISEDEIEDAGKNVTSQEKSRISEKNLAPSNKSQKSESGESISENEIAISEESPMPENFILREESQKSGKSLDGRSRQSQSDESTSGNEIEDRLEKSTSKNATVQEKSHTLRKSVTRHEKFQTPVPSDVDEGSEEEYSDEIVPATRLGLSGKSSEPRKSVANKSRQRISSEMSDDENPQITEKSIISSKSVKTILPERSVGDIRAEDAEKTGRANSPAAEKLRGKSVSEASRRKIPFDGASNDESNEASISSRGPNRTALNESRSSLTRLELSKNRDIDEMENAENRENPTSLRKSVRPHGKSRNDSTMGKSLNMDVSAFSMGENLRNASGMLPTSTPKVPSIHRSNDNLRKQKSITEFLSKFRQPSDNSRTIAPPANFDQEKFNIARKRVEEMKQRAIEAMKIDAPTKQRETIVPKRPGNIARPKNPFAKNNATPKKTKVVDKAYIVNGVVYKRPKLPRPKPWVTDRLYNHLWKLMEPNYKIATRVKSEKFVQQLAEVVALTIRRKKYNSYKIEVDCLMKDMAKLGIIKTRNDFYDFCYDFLPYDFRVKVTPMLLPGNIHTIPYDPDKLYTPIISEN